MHEFALADSLLNAVLRVAEEQRAQRVLACEVRCGVLQQVDAEALQLAFDALRRDTPAAGAELRLVEEPLAAECGACGERFTPRLDDFRCAKCGCAAPRWLSGHEIVLQTVECETGDAL